MPKKKKSFIGKMPIAYILTAAIVLIVLLVCGSSLAAYLHVYRTTIEQTAVTSSEQAVTQVEFMVKEYMDDMGGIMKKIRDNSARQTSGEGFLESLLSIRSDIVAVAAYDTTGKLIDCHLGEEAALKESFLSHPDYISDIGWDESVSVSKPHVETMIENYYPWVVTFSELMDYGGKKALVCMDIRFSKISEYVDNVGIGPHGYCFIVDDEGSLVYHPQQQLINAGLKTEDTEIYKNVQNGVIRHENVIYTVRQMENANWKIVGVCYVDEMITSKIQNMLHIIFYMLIFTLLVALLAGMLISKIISKPSTELAKAMQEFESDAEQFEFAAVTGTREITALSDSFGHMVLRIQNLMERVRQEEMSVRKTELSALQAQINPHFLYNTLDSIAWMCEEERNKEAITMVNALARLFRISISKGHELITIEDECQHAGSYLQIQNYRYKNKFTYNFDVEPESLHYLCNKITLQPIIENAIYHGLNMVDDGEINIGVKVLENEILMFVEDNGVGMDEQKCKEILSKESGGRTGIGIKNVNDRIKIYFGEGYGLTIISEPDEGTRVEIRMPKIPEEKLNEY